MVSYVGGDDTSTSGTTTSLTWPAVDANDQALLFWTGQNGFTFTNPTGFTLVEAFVANSGTHESRLYRKTCVGDEDAGSISLQVGTANKHSATLLVYRGVSTSAPINNYDAVDEDTASGSPTCPQVTPSVPGCAAVVAYSERLSDGTQNITQPTGYTKREQITSQNGGGATFLSTADDGLATAHPSGVAVSPGSFTGADATANAVTWTVLLAPASQTVSVGQATETETANAITWSPKHRLVGQVTETEIAVGMVKQVDVSIATETETALAIEPALRPVVDWTISIDWDADGHTEDDDVTTRTLGRTGFDAQYGRDQSRSLSPSAVGRASFSLDNESKDYSPDNPDSPLFGKLVQARPVRVDATFNATPMNVNPTFTSDIDHWTANNCTLTHETVIVHPDGSGSMKITPTGASSAGGAGSDLTGAGTVTGGEAYRASLWAYSTNGYDALHILVNWYDSTDTFISTTKSLAYTVEAATWTQIEDTFTAPVTADHAAVWAWQEGSPAASDVWYVWNITLIASANKVTLFRGFTDEYTVQPAIGDRSVALTALDALGKLQGALVTTALHSGISTGDAIGEILDALGWPTWMRSLDPGATIVRWWWVENQDALEAIEELVRSEGPGAILYADENGRIVFRDRHHRLFNAPSVTAQTTFTDTDEEEPAFSGFTYDHGWREVVNSVSVKVEELDPAPALVIVWENEGITSVEENDVLTLRVTLDNPVVRPDWEIADVLAGSATVDFTVDSGQTVTLTITPTPGAGFICQGLRIYAQELTVSRAYTVLVEDQASIAKYGKRSMDYEIPWAGINDAKAVAQLVLDASAERRPIVTITMRSGTWFDSTRLTQQVTRNISDRVHVREPQTFVDHDFHVEQIKHVVSDAGLLIETELGLERAINHPDNVFRFDDATYGFDNGVFGGLSMQDPDLLFRFDVAGQGFDDGVFAT